MKVKDLIKIIGSVSTVLILLFGVSLVTVFKKAKVIVQYPEHRRELIINDSVMDHAIHDLIHAQEFTWDLMRLMTDNHDSSKLFTVVDAQGDSHEVDIRHNAEMVELAFVFDYFVVFQVRRENVDNRRYILVHDYETGETEKYFIE
jgi:hypothetical protein